jgi:internalin A
LYHGTHGLFIRSSGPFVVCWTPDLEDGVEDDPSGLEFPNRPLAYWLSWIAATAGKDVAVICIQTQADNASDARLLDPIARELLDSFAFHRNFASSAKVGRGFGALTDALNDAFDWQQEKTGGALTGAGRIAVMDRLNAWRQADQVLPAKERQKQTLTKAEFAALCDETGGVSDSDQLLVYLNAIGLVFYRKGMFEDKIVLDQAWALDAIYTIFTRGTCAIPLKAMGGRFTAKVLSVLAWPAKSTDEQALLLSMMRSCGIAFPLDSSWQWTEHTEWLAPALLPARDTMAALIERDWEVGGDVSSHTFDYDFMHDGLFRTLMAEVGRQAGYAGTYWDKGFIVYETKTRSRLKVEAERGENWSGSLKIQTRGQSASELLLRAQKLVENSEQLSGLAHGRRKAGASTTRLNPSQTETKSDFPDADDHGSNAVQFGFEKRNGPIFALTYAHKNEAHPDIEAPVDAIELAAKARGVNILRDKNNLGIGDRISVFARELAAAETSIIVLSHKYMTAGEHCMQELFRIHRRLRSDPKRLAKECKIWALPCAPIHDRDYRKQIADHWSKVARLDTNSPQFGRQIHDKAGTNPAWNPSSFANEIADILAAIDDVIRDVSFDSFLESCFSNASKNMPMREAENS